MAFFDANSLSFGGAGYGSGPAMITPAGVGGAGISQAIGQLAAPQAQAFASPVTGAAGIPGVGLNGNAAATPLGWNVGTLNLGLGGLQALGNIWSAWQANQLAQKQFAFQKDVTNTNLANQIQSYNTTLEDRVRARAQVEQGQANGLQPGAQAQSYLDSHKLASRTIG